MAKDKISFSVDKPPRLELKHHSLYTTSPLYRSSVAETKHQSLFVTSPQYRSTADSKHESLFFTSPQYRSSAAESKRESQFVTSPQYRSSTAESKRESQFTTSRSSVAESKHESQYTTVKRVKAKYGNPTPLGLSAFALSVFVTSFYDAGLFGIDKMDMIVGVALFTGGVVQFAAGLWEFKVGNTFGATGFSAFGGFWASYGVIYLQKFGIQAAFNNDLSGETFNHALGIYYAAWTIFTIIFTMACLRTSLGVLMAFVFLSLDFIFLTASTMLMIPILTRVAGICGIICSSIVWYCFAAVLLTPDLSPISLPTYDLSKSK